LRSVPTLGALEPPGRLPAAQRRHQAAALPPGHDKLTTQLLPGRTRELIATLLVKTRVAQLGELASVDIGAVTGANDFFLVSSEVADAPPPPLLRPAVSKANHIQGTRLRAEDHQRLVRAGQRMQLFVALADSDPEHLSAAAPYLARGVAAGLPQRYKCR